MISQYLFVCFCFVIVNSGLCSNHVPVIGWGTSNNPIAFPSVFAGQETSTEEFTKNYLNTLTAKGNKDLIVFIQDKLSLHDISLNANAYDDESDGGLFKNLKSVLDENMLFSLPNVDDPSRAITLFKNSFEGKTHKLSYPYSLDGIVNEEYGNLIIVPLPKLHGNIKYIDSIIGQVTKDLLSAGRPFTALYTAKRPSKVPSASLHSSRNLLAVSNSGNESDITVISNCSLLYAKNIKFGVWSGEKYDVIDISKSFTANTSCPDEGTIGTIALSFTDLGDTLKSFSLTLDLKVGKDGYWYMNTSADWEKDFSISGKDKYMSKSVWAPVGYSYHCTNTRFPAIMENGGIPTTYVSIQGLQVELSVNNKVDVSEPSFSYPNDCDGYFSIGSLLGLFVGLILALIFAFGITMLSQINTMDRFDDPKGKSIAVNVSE